MGVSTAYFSSKKIIDIKFISLYNVYHYTMCFFDCFRCTCIMCIKRQRLFFCLVFYFSGKQSMKKCKKNLKELLFESLSLKKWLRK